LALRVGYIGPWAEALELELTEPHGKDDNRSIVDVYGMSSGVWCTINNQLRTGTDKGNLTV
jgi:hypothetical protein